MRRVAVAGHVCVDLVPELGPTARLTPGALIDVGPLAFRVGGCVANTARTLADLGHPVTAYATAGTDELADVLRARLHHPLIDQRLTTRAGSTSYSLVLEPGADRTFWHHVGVNSATDGADIPLDDVDLLHLGYPSLLPALLSDDAAPLLDLLQRARDAGVTTSLDLAVIDPSSAVARIDWGAVLPRIVAHVDIISPSVDDLASAIPELADGADAARLAALLSDWGAAVAVVSAGTEGVALHTGTAERLRRSGRALAPLAAPWADTVLRAPARTVADVRTTNGAGDASTAGLLYAVSLGMPPRDALRLATECAAAAVSGLPAPQETATRLPAAAPAPAPDSAPTPLLLPANQPTARFYRGGERIAQWRGSDAPARSHTPEDWVASVVAVRGSAPLGMTTLPDGRLLRDAVDADPVGWLGSAHVARYGPDPLLLVKILDAGQRLPVHAHPDGDFARRHLGAHHGKAEAWHILTPGVVHLGLRRDVAAGELARLVATQDTASLLALLHEVPVAPGDRVFVPPGMLHAIGEGVLLVEVQEPEDLSILLEWRDFTLDGEKDGHLGIGFGRALTAVDHRELDPDRLDALVRRAGHPETGLPTGAAAYFRLDALTVRGTTTTESGFAVLVGLDGEVGIDGTTGLRLTGGSTAVVPAAHGALRLTGAGTVLVARPPAP